VIFVVIDHQAQAGSEDRDARDQRGLHRGDEALVKKEILAAGFVLVAESDILANPADARDKSIFANDGPGRDRTDRFVIRFRKPRTP